MYKILVLLLLLSCNTRPKQNYQSKEIDAAILSDLSNNSNKIKAIKNLGTLFDFYRSGKKETVMKTYYYDSMQNLHFIREERLYNYDLNPSKKEVDTFLYTNYYYINNKLVKMECDLKSANTIIRKANYYFQGNKIVFQSGLIPDLYLRPSIIAIKNDEVNTLKNLLKEY